MELVSCGSTFCLDSEEVPRMPLDQTSIDEGEVTICSSRQYWIA
jgi:hypothetical protein